MMFSNDRQNPVRDSEVLKQKGHALTPPVDRSDPSSFQKNDLPHMSKKLLRRNRSIRSHSLERRFYAMLNRRFSYLQR
jgi:hypothetical protein